METSYLELWIQFSCGIGMEIILHNIIINHIFIWLFNLELDIFQKIWRKNWKNLFLKIWKKELRDLKTVCTKSVVKVESEEIILHNFIIKDILHFPKVFQQSMERIQKHFFFINLIVKLKSETFCFY